MSFDFSEFAKGLFTNVWMTVLSCILPMAVGVLLAYFGNEKIRKTLSWVAIPFESICPVIFLMFVCYNVAMVAHFSRVAIAIVAFSICFMGYIPARYSESDSKLKNLVYHGLGLFATVFSWSFCTRMIGVYELLGVANNYANMKYEYDILLLPLIVAMAILAAIHVARRMVKEKME